MPWIEIKEFIQLLGFPIFALVMIGIAVNRFAIFTGQVFIVPLARKCIEFVDNLIAKVNKNEQTLTRLAEDFSELRDDVNVMRDDLNKLLDEEEYEDVRDSREGD